MRDPLFIIATGFVVVLALVIIARHCDGVGCALRSPFFWLVVVLGVVLPAMVMVFDIVTMRTEYVVTTRWYCRASSPCVTRFVGRAAYP